MAEDTRDIETPSPLFPSPPRDRRELTKRLNIIHKMAVEYEFLIIYDEDFRQYRDADDPEFLMECLINLIGSFHRIPYELAKQMAFTEYGNLAQETFEEWIVLPSSPSAVPIMTTFLDALKVPLPRGQIRSPRLFVIRAHALLYAELKSRHSGVDMNARFISLQNEAKDMRHQRIRKAFAEERD
jgi:hypothetical protein